MPVGTVRPPRYQAWVPTTAPPDVDVVPWRTPAESACRTWSPNTAARALTSPPCLLRPGPRPPGTLSSRPAKAVAAVPRNLVPRSPLVRRPNRRALSHLNTVGRDRTPDGRGQITRSHRPRHRTPTRCPTGAAECRVRSRSRTAAVVPPTGASPVRAVRRHPRSPNRPSRRTGTPGRTCRAARAGTRPGTASRPLTGCRSSPVPAWAAARDPSPTAGRTANPWPGRTAHR